VVFESGASPLARVLALDLGQKRIGLAMSDALGLTAQGLDVLRRTTLREDLDRVARVAAERKASRILVGLPVHMNGEESPMSRRVRAFASKLAEITGLPVELLDERLTSVAAEDLLAARGWSLARLLEEKRRGAVDRLAAVLLLDDWMRKEQSGS
jgi:putative Holliday junction resolvase